MAQEEPLTSDLPEPGQPPQAGAEQARAALIAGLSCPPRKQRAGPERPWETEKT